MKQKILLCALREWMTDPAIYKYWGMHSGKNDKRPELLFEKAKKPTKSFHWGSICRADGKAIGELWVFLIENDRMAKVAYRLNPKYQGNGYASEALAAAEIFALPIRSLSACGHVWICRLLAVSLKSVVLSVRDLSGRESWKQHGVIIISMVY